MEVGILPCILLLILAKDDDVIELRPAALPLWVLTTILEVLPAGTVWPLSTIPAAVNQTEISNYHWSFWCHKSDYHLNGNCFFITKLHDWFKNFAPLFHPIRSQPKPIVIPSHKFSRALRRLHAITSSFDWFAELPLSFVIDQSDWHSENRSITTLDYTPWKPVLSISATFHTNTFLCVE